MSVCCRSITHMLQYQHSSFEELRVGDYASDRRKCQGHSSFGSSGAGAGSGGNTGSFGSSTSSELQGAGAAGTGKRSEETPLNQSTVTVTEACQEKIIGSLARCSRLLAEPSGSDPLRTPVVELQLLRSLQVRAGAPGTMSDNGAALQPSGDATHLSAESAFIRLRGMPDLSWQECKVQFTAFGTCRSLHRCAPGRKAYYELEILADVTCPQFGFCNPRMGAAFGGISGAGDCVDSWAVDGVRQKKWHHGQHGWPADRWKPGDVIGLACDLEQGQLWFSINGAFLAPYGPVFSSLSKNDIDKGLYACFSAATGQVRYNLGEQGSAPFKHAPPGFRPFAECPCPMVANPSFDHSKPVAKRYSNINAAKRSAGRGSARVTSHAKSGQKAISTASRSAAPDAAPEFAWSAGGGATSMEIEQQAAGAGDSLLFACVHTCASHCCCNADARVLKGGKTLCAMSPCPEIVAGMRVPASPASPATPIKTQSAEASGVGIVVDEDEMEADMPRIHVTISLIETSSKKCIASVNQDGELLLRERPRPRIGDQVR